MVREERRAARYAIMRRVLAKNQRGELVPITITDISEHGIGLFSKKKIDVGELLSFELALSNAMSITVQARLLWTRHSLGVQISSACPTPTGDFSTVGLRAESDATRN
jgi:hypothetical protein